MRRNDFVKKAASGIAFALAVAVAGTTMAFAAVNQVSESQAKEKAFNLAGIQAEDVPACFVELDQDDGIRYYEVNFLSGTTRHEVDVNVEDGTILSYSKKMQKSPSYSTSTIGLAKAKEAALNYAGLSALDVTFSKAKLEWDDGIHQYEMKFYDDSKTYEVDLIASSGEIVEYQWERLKTVQSNVSNGSGITLEQAQNIALQHAGVSTSNVLFTKAKRDYDDGIMTYEVEFRLNGWEYEYEIDASTGAILEFDIDD